jgi:DNA (cytosine-5)-methyltransferase 1
LTYDTDDSDVDDFVPEDPAQDDQMPDNTAPAVEGIIEQSQSDEEVIDLTDKLSKVGGSFNIDHADCMTDDEFQAWLPCRPRERPTHNIQEAVVDGIVYRPSMSLKLRDNSYLRIEQIRRRSGEYFLYGRHLLATTDRRTEKYIPKVKGELVWMTNAAGPVSLDEVAGHQGIRFTNERTDWHDHEDLVCRLKVTVRARNEPPVRRRDPLNADERIIEYLSFEDSDPGQGWASTDLRDCWRGPAETVPFGAVEMPPALRMQINGPEVIDLEDTSPPSVDFRGQRDRTYTFGDAYSGAGGASCGARQAGLINTWASDINGHAVDTYRRNFDGTVIYHAEFFQLMTIPESELRVDIAHCSPPCQPFSPAHTVSNQTNDERNSACVFTGSDLIKRARPRILTMEETNGLHERFKPEFNRIILNFIQDGYSVRWSVLECAYYGVPQYRKRLMIIAAG